MDPADFTDGQPSRVESVSSTQAVAPGAEWVAGPGHDSFDSERQGLGRHESIAVGDSAAQTYLVSAFLVEENDTSQNLELLEMKQRLDLIEREARLLERELELERVQKSFKNKPSGIGGFLKRATSGGDNSNSPRGGTPPNVLSARVTSARSEQASVTSFGGLASNVRHAFCEASVALVYDSEIKTNKALFTGTFNTVLGIKKVKLKFDGGFQQEENRHRHLWVAFLENGVDNNHEKCVMKRIRPGLDGKKHDLAAKRLAYEARLLVRLRNNVHMAKVLAVSATGEVDSTFFFVIEKPIETLFQRITKSWPKQQKNNNGKPHFLLSLVNVGTDLVAALDHLHCNNVLHSDLKPENVGFDGAGTLKLFNLSKAKALSKKGGGPKRPYDTSIRVSSVYHGTAPYAAPEISAKPPIPCGLSVDIYAFGIVLWEIFHIRLCFGRKDAGGAFSGLVADEYSQRVVKSNQRPKIDTGIPSAIQRIINRCWETDSDERPPVQEVHAELKAYQDKLGTIM